MSRKQAYYRLGVILLIFGLLSLAHSIWLPLHKAPDEIAHFQYSRFIADKGRLPINYEERDIAGFKSDWPPLYHMAVAALVGWSDSDGPPYLKFVRESPRFDMARELLDTKRLANSEDELPPYRGAVLMWHLGRVVSIILSMGTIVVTFFTTLEFFPKKYRLAVFSAAIIAFVPVFIFISSAMSDDPLVGLVVGLYVLILIKIVKGDNRLRYYIGLGLLVGLAATTKYSTVILPAQVIVVVSYLASRHKWGWWGWLKKISVVGGAAIVASSWWFLWVMINFQEMDKFGLVIGLLKPILAGGIDPSQKYVAFLLTGGQIGTTESPDIVPEPFWLWLVQIYQSFWAVRIGDYPLEPVAHILMGLVCLVTVIGLVQVWRRQPASRVWVALFVFQIWLFSLFPFLRFLILGHVDQSAQGRHVLFPIATILPLLMIYGWQAYLSAKIQRQLALVVVSGLVCWSLVQAVRVATFYTPVLPIRTTTEIISQIPHRLDKSFGDHLILLGYDLQVKLEANALNVSLYWQSPTYADEDYLMRVRLVQDGQPQLQWSAYPVNGRYPTRIWESWETIRDDISFPLLDLAPGPYQVQLQLLGTGGPLSVDGTDTLTVAEIILPTVSPSEPNTYFPVVLDGAEVVRGLSLWQAEAYRELGLPKYRPRMAIPFVWQGQLSDQERIQWLLVGPQGEAYHSYTASPHFEYFVVGLDWPSGDYRLRAEVWRDEMIVASQETAPLVTIFNERPRQVQSPLIAHPLNGNFANKVKLLGYDLPTRSLSPGQGVPLTLYWQGLRTMGQNYTVFTKLFDGNQQLWGSAERLPADGYNTIYWLENEIVTDSFELPVDPTIPAGIYWLNVGLYEEIDGEAVSLSLILADQPSEVTSITFGPIKVGGPPPDFVFQDQEIFPDKPVSIKFGEPPVVLLRGYDLAQEDETLQLVFYWESLAPTPTNWSYFVHVRDEAEDTIAQKDGPVGSGNYPSSVWDAGDIVADKIMIPVENLPDGQYGLYLGLYDINTGIRLPISEEPTGSILLENIKP